MEPEQSSEPVTTATVPDGVLGEDMLQMALRMATEMTEPVLDLEDSLPASSIKGAFNKIIFSLNISFLSCFRLK